MADLKNTGPSDESLLLKAKTGDKTAFEAFYNRHKRHILNYAYRMTGDLRSAEEITQDAFLKAYLNLKRYKSQGKALNWIFTIAGNLCRNYFRRKKHEPGLMLNKELSGKEGLSMQDVIPAGVDTPSGSAISRETETLVQQCISRLPVKYREIVILCDIQGHSYEEAAAILRCGTGTVGSRLSRARAILAKNLKNIERP